MPLLGRALVVGIAIWVVVMLAAPAATQSRQPLIAGLAATVYVASGVICHQRPERSFAIAGRQLPVCARCSGLYASALLGALLAMVSPRRQARAGTARWLLLAAAAPTGISWAIERLGFTHVNNVTRAALAIPLGVVAAWLVVSMLRDAAPGKDAQAEERERQRG